LKLSVDDPRHCLRTRIASPFVAAKKKNLVFDNRAAESPPKRLSSRNGRLIASRLFVHELAVNALS
jgi:hypothetical protein